MWVLVLRADTGTPITNARFSVSYYNAGNGNYYVYFTQWNQSFICSADGFNSYWGSIDYYSSMTVWLARYVPPPPSPPPTGGWT